MIIFFHGFKHRSFPEVPLKMILHVILEETETKKKKKNNNLWIYYLLPLRVEFDGSLSISQGFAKLNKTQERSSSVTAPSGKEKFNNTLESAHFNILIWAVTFHRTLRKLPTLAIQGKKKLSNMSQENKIRSSNWRKPIRVQQLDSQMFIILIET